MHPLSSCAGQNGPALAAGEVVRDPRGRGAVLGEPGGRQGPGNASVLRRGAGLCCSRCAGAEGAVGRAPAAP